MSPRRSRTRLGLDERRAQLLVLGRELFNSRPYDAISIDDIAQAAGISKGLLYHYFDSKLRFYVETVRAAFEEMSDLTEPDPTLPPLEQLDASLDAYLEYVERSGNSYDTLLQSGIGTDPEVQALVEEQRLLVIQRVLKAVGLAEPPPAVRMALRGWLGFIDAACLDWVKHRDVDRKAVRILLANSLHNAMLTAVQMYPQLDIVLPVANPEASATESAAQLAAAIAKAESAPPPATGPKL